jgi:hypothetical protein
MPLTSSITKTAEGLYELSMSGRLHRPHWVVQLFAALSQLHVSICSGYATQDDAGGWQSKFVLDFSNSSANPQELDYATFTEQTATGDRSGTPKLSRFELKRRADQFLVLKVEGPDQIGFLAAILNRVSILSLFPSSLEIDTYKGEIRDAIVLRGISGRGPSDAAYQTLERMLRAFIVSP